MGMNLRKHSKCAAMYANYKIRLPPTCHTYVNIPRHGQRDAGCASYANASDILMRMCVGTGPGPG